MLFGEGSQFHQTFGYYAQGVGPDLPDLFITKAVAGREKDREFYMAMLAHGFVRPVELLGLAEDMPIEGQGQRRLRSAIRRWVKVVRERGHQLPKE